MDSPIPSPPPAAASAVSLGSFFEAILTPSPLVFAVGVAIVLLFPIVLHFALIASSPYSSLPAILLLGPSGAGKTSLAALIERGPDAGKNGSLPDTHTSQVPLVVELTAARGIGYEDAARDTASGGGAGDHTRLLLVDVPGHGKLRGQAMDRLVPAALESSKVAGVVFVVDAAGLCERDVLAETGEYLYAVLLALQRRAAANRSARPVPVLVAANKLDLFTALPAAAVRAALEGELTRIRSSRSKGLLDSGVGADDVGSEEQDDWLGEYGTEGFVFDQMADFNVRVDVLSGSVRGDRGSWKGIDSWWAWISERF